jgi:hypothetical protein
MPYIVEIDMTGHNQDSVEDTSVLAGLAYILDDQVFDK